MVIIGIVFFIIAAVAMNIYLFTKGKMIGYNKAIRDNPSPIAPIEIVCLCGHGPNFHIDGGKCDQTVVWQMRSERIEFMDRNVKCRCRQYTGPEFLPTVIDRLELELR